MKKAAALLLLALCAVVAVSSASAIESDVPLTSDVRHRDTRITDDRVGALRQSAMRDDVDRVSRLDTDRIGGHTIVRDRFRDRDLPLRRSHGKALRISRFNADKQKFDLRRAEGVWYQHAVNRDFYNRFEKGCSCPVALVRVKSDTESMVEYACVNKTGDLTVVRGVKRMESPGKFAMTPVEKRIGEKVIKAREDKKLGETSHDEILALDHDMQWKIMYNPKMKGVFIYSRKPVIDDRILKDMLAFIEKHTEGKISTKDMKLFKHQEMCGKLRSTIREFTGKYNDKGKGKINEPEARPRSHSAHHHSVHESSGAEPRRDEKPGAKADDNKSKLDLSMLKGQWYEIARSRVASQTTERGCKCGLAFFDVSENAFNSQYACLNATAKDDESKVATASGRAVMDPNQEGVFRSKMLSKVPGKLSEDEAKERKLILLALGDNFAACLEPDRKVVHILSRNTTMEKDLVSALSEMLQSIGINPQELDRVDQTAATCSAFHEKAKTKFGAKAKGAVHGLETKQGLQQTGAADTHDEKVSGSGKTDEKRDDKSKEGKLLGHESGDRQSIREDSQSQSSHGFIDSEGVEQRARIVYLIPQGSDSQTVMNQQPLMAEQSQQSQPLMTEQSQQPQPLMGDESQALGGIEMAAPAEQQGAPAAAAAPADDSTPPPLDATILGGNWFNIAVSQDAYNMYYRGCECAQKFIQALDSNKLHLVGGCLNKTDNQLVTCVEGGVQDPASPGLFRIQLLDKQPYGLTAAEKSIHEKVILAVGKDFAVIAEPAINSAWILSRTPTMAADLFDRLITLLGKIGFSKESMRKFNQGLPECQAVTTQMQAIGKQAGQQSATPAAAPAPAAPAAPAAAPTAPAPAPAAAPAAPAAAPAAAPTAAPAPAPAAPAPAAPAAPAAAPAMPTRPQRPRVFAGTEQPLAGDQQQQYIGAENPAYYGGGDYYTAEQPYADDQYSYSG